MIPATMSDPRSAGPSNRCVTVARGAFALALGVAAAVATASCGTAASATFGLDEGCSINSDCNAPLICAFSRCHNECTQSRDCPSGERCVSAGADSVCQLAIDDVCGVAASCAAGLACVGGQCRNVCSTDVACTVAGQTCLAGGCYDAEELQSLGADAAPSVDAIQPNEDAVADATLAEAAPLVDATGASPWFPSAEAGPLGFIPSNVGPLALLAAEGDAQGGVDAANDAGVWSGAPGAFITQQCTNCLPAAATTITMNDGSFADLYVLDALAIEPTAALRLSGSRPVILAVRTTVDIQGLLLINGVGTSPGPGGYAPGANPGPGAGQSGAAFPGSAGGGGSYCGTGGAGGSALPPVAPGGTPYGSPALVPLAGGSAGASCGYGGSGGGGAIQIVAGTGITVGMFGAINAGGGGGTANCWGGGASGGAILLEAPSIVIDGTLAANGGGGSAVGTAAPNGDDGASNDQPAAGGAPGGSGSAATAIDGSDGEYLADAGGANGAGGGGAGRIRLNSSTGAATINGTVSPSLDSADGGTPCATQGTLGE